MDMLTIPAWLLVLLVALLAGCIGVLLALRRNDQHARPEGWEDEARWWRRNAGSIRQAPERTEWESTFGGA